MIVKKTGRLILGAKLSKDEEKAMKIEIQKQHVERVFAIDNRPGLARSCAESIKNKSIESCIAFADLLEREAVRII